MTRLQGETKPHHSPVANSVFLCLIFYQFLSKLRYYDMQTYSFLLKTKCISNIYTEIYINPFYKKKPTRIPPKRTSFTVYPVIFALIKINSLFSRFLSNRKLLIPRKNIMFHFYYTSLKSQKELTQIKKCYIYKNKNRIYGII